MHQLPKPEERKQEEPDSAAEREHRTIAARKKLEKVAGQPENRQVAAEGSRSSDLAKPSMLENCSDTLPGCDLRHRSPSRSVLRF